MLAVIYFGDINSEMTSSKVDLNFIIDPLPTDGAGIYIGQDAERVAALRERVPGGRSLKEGKAMIGLVMNQSPCCRETNRIKRTV